MPRSRIQVSHETLAEEARFILRTLMRKDLFGEKARLTEAERLIANSISMSFADYAGFLSKYGYVRIDSGANVVEVTDAGIIVVKNADEPEFYARLGRHFSRELGTSPALRPHRREPNAPAPSRAPVEPVTAMSPEPRGPADEVLDRRYRRGAEIGAGPIGTVFAGEHIGLGSSVAIKEARSIFQYVSYIKREEIVRRWTNVVQDHAKLAHTNIIAVTDHNAEREHPYFITEYAEGGNLRQRLEAAENGRLSVSVAVRILLQTCYALKYAHAQGVLHLGIKPENVLFDHFGNVKLSDFGLSAIADREERTSQIPVLVGSGTVAYMPPERMQPGADDGGLGPAADVYGLGILVYQMLTGKLPGRRSPLPSQVRKGKEIPAAFDDVFDRMTRDELSDRYTSIDEVLAGVYKAFPNKEVFAKGTILLWSEDPTPLPVPEADAEPDATEDSDDDAKASTDTDAPEPEAKDSEPPEASADADASEASSDLPSGPPAEEETTGEVDVRAFQSGDSDDDQPTS